MSDHIRERIPSAAGLETRTNIDADLVQESVGKDDNTVHGIPPFTVPRADGTLEYSPDNQANGPRTATARMMRRRQNESSHGDQDGDGNYTNQKGYRDGHGSDDDHDASQDKNRNSEHSHRGWDGAEHQHGLMGQLKSGVTTKKSLFQRVRRATIPTLLGVLVAWYYDAVDVLIYRNDPRINGYLLTFSLLCLLTMLSIFFYLEFIRPRILGKQTNYVSWEKELLYPVRIATLSLIAGSIGANIALWPVWHLSTMLVLVILAVALVNFLGIFF